MGDPVPGGLVAAVKGGAVRGRPGWPANGTWRGSVPPGRGEPRRPHHGLPYRGLLAARGDSDKGPAEARKTKVGHCAEKGRRKWLGL